MSLSVTINKAVYKAFDSLGDLKTSVTYSEFVGLGTYNPTTDSANDTPVSHTLSVIIIDKQDDEIDGINVKRGDKEMIIRGYQLSFTPKINDYVTFNSERWNILALENPPSSAAYFLHIRR